jgi:transcriptional regulator with XRE-family HTH domain
VSGAGEIPVIAVRLREARERLGITQIELGRRVGMDLGVASPRINQYEKGVHVPHHTTAARIARELGVPLAYLYAEDDQLARWILAWAQMSAAERRRRLKELEE